MNWLSWLGITIGLAGGVAAAAPPNAELVRLDRIWDQAPHCAFTDLIRWKGRFVCAFREGRGHVSADGKIRILVSPNGSEWKSAALVELKGFDLRDAGLTTTPDGRLMLIGGASPRRADGESAPTGTVVSFSDDAAKWTTPKIVVEPGRWLWRVVWNNTTAYGVSYAAGDPNRSTALLASSDGLHFREVVPSLLDQGYPTEATLRFDEHQTLYCLQRRDGGPLDNTAMLGMSQPPYEDWQWFDLGMFFGGPNFIGTPGGRWIAAGRVMRDDGPRTELAWLDMEQKSLTPILTLPSGGDTSYPGLVWHDGFLWLSYYASHEGDKASIYLAKIKLD